MFSYFVSRTPFFAVHFNVTKIVDKDSRPNQSIVFREVCLLFVGNSADTHLRASTFRKKFTWSASSGYKKYRYSRVALKTRRGVAMKYTAI